MTPDELLEMDLSVGGGDWKPTPHGEHLASVLAHQNLVADQEVLELGGGVANHTIILLRQGPTKLVTTEITKERLRTTRTNVEHNCGVDPRIEYRVANWLDTEGRFDVVISNPPFAKSGKQNRRYFIDRLILDAHHRLRRGGLLVFVQSSMADIAKSWRRLEENGYEPRRLGETEGPFRDYYFEDQTFMEEIQTVPDGFEVRDGTYYETLVVLGSRLRPWKPPAGADL